MGRCCKPTSQAAPWQLEHLTCKVHTKLNSLVPFLKPGIGSRS